MRCKVTLRLEVEDLEDAGTRAGFHENTDVLTKPAHLIDVLSDFFRASCSLTEYGTPVPADVSAEIHPAGSRGTTQGEK